ATFALKAGEWFRRGRLLMVSPVHGDYRRYQAEIPLIALSKFPRPALLAVEVDYAPGAASPAHTHAKSAFIYAYVISGAIESKVNNGSTPFYREGGSGSR